MTVHKNQSYFSFSYFFRTLIPKWRFFENYGHTPVLYYKIFHKDNDLQTSSWKNALPYTKRNFFHLFININTNLTHSYIGILNQFFLEINEANTELIETSTTYNLIKKIIEAKIKNECKILTNNALATENIRYQFKIVAEITTSNFNLSQQDLLISKIYTL